MLFALPEGGRIPEKSILPRTKTGARGRFVFSFSPPSPREVSKTSPVLLPGCLSSAEEFLSSDLLGFYWHHFLWKKTLSLFKSFYQSLKLSAGCIYPGWPLSAVVLLIFPEVSHVQPTMSIFHMPTISYKDKFVNTSFLV